MEWKRLAGRVVVPLDGSENAENAVPFALLAGRVFEGPIHLIHVQGNVLPDETKGDLPSPIAYLEGVARRFGIDDARTSVYEGYAPDVILDAAVDAGILTLATHGRGGFHSVFIGSVADKVIRGAETPVLVVPGIGGPSSPGQGSVLAAVDGSSASVKALALARRFAGASASAVWLLRAWSIPTAYGGIYYPPEMLESGRAEAIGCLREVALPGEELVVTSEIPSDAIRSTAHKIDAQLVAVGSHGETLARRVFLGSTTDRLVHSLARPLLIVP